MLQVHDIRETRVYQEAKEEGIKEGIEKGIEKGVNQERQRQLQAKLQSIAKMAASMLTPEKIAEFLDLDIELVRNELGKCRP